MIKLNYRSEGRFTFKMVILINLLGSPSCGKTTLSAQLFADLKIRNLNAELCPEYVKAWAWELKKIGPFSQFYIFGKEVYHQSRLFDKVDFIISDSPAMLSAFYHYYYNKNGALNEVCQNYYKLAEKSGVEVLNFFLPRKKKYIQQGRYQTEKEADEVAEGLKKWLAEQGYTYTYLDCPDEDRLDVIIQKLKEITGDFNGMFLA